LRPSCIVGTATLPVVGESRREAAITNVERAAFQLRLG
jgi:hypothetical protein